MRHSCSLLLVIFLTHTAWSQPGSRSGESQDPIQKAFEEFQSQFPHRPLFPMGREAMKQESQLDSSYGYVFDNNTWEIDSRIRYEYPNTTDEIQTLSKWNASTHRWEPFSKRLTIFDEDSLVSETISQYWETLSSSWVNNRKTIFKQDEQERFLRYAIMDWDENLHAWIGILQYLRSYTNEGLEVDNLYQKWDVSLANWKNVEKWHATNNPDGYEISRVVWNWNDSSQIWNSKSQESYVRNSENKPEMYLAEIYDMPSQTWINSFKQIFAYNVQGNEMEQITQTWDTSHVIWENVRRYLSDYDIHENIISYISQNWDTTQIDWVNDERNLREVNAQGKDSLTMTQRWNVSLSTWEHVDLQLFDWTADGLRIRFANFIWKDNFWEKNYRFNSTYDLFGNEMDWIYFLKDPAANEWLEKEKVVYFWTNASSSGITDFVNLACKFPNPMKMNEAYHCPSLEATHMYQLRIFDLAGRLIQQEEFRGNEPITLRGNITKGVYLLVLSEEGTLRYRNKILLE